MATVTPRTMYEVKRQNRFLLLFPSDVGGEALQASVLSSARPKWAVSDQELHYLNTRWWISGKPTWETWTCEFYDYVDDNTLQEMFKWYKKVFNPEDFKMQVPNQYKKNVTIQMLGPGLEGDIIEKYDLYGVWPTSVDGGPLSMSEEGTVAKISVTFRFDYAILKS